MSIPRPAPPARQGPGDHPVPQGMVAAPVTPPCRSLGERCYTVELPAALPLLTANDRAAHWGRRAAATAGIRAATAALARVTGIPAADQAWITVVLYPHNRRRLDPHNWGPSAKAAIDGLVDARVLPDDDFGHLLAVTFMLGALRPARQLALHITPITPPSAASTTERTTGR